MLTDLLGKPDAKTPLRPDQLRYAFTPGAESITGAKHMAQLLFMVIREHHGDRIARRIFAMWGTPPSKRRLSDINNLALLDRLDLMKKPNVEQLARQLIAEHEKTVPKQKRRGASGIDAKNLAKQIRRQRDRRKAAMKKGTWYGPIPDRP